MKCLLCLAVALCLCGGACASLRNGFLLVGDLDTHAVLRFTLSGELVNEFVKRGSGGLRSPGGLAMWSPAASTTSTIATNQTREGGALYVASTGSDQVLQFNGMNGRFERVLATVTAPQDLLFHNTVLYVTSSQGDRILRFRAGTGAPLGVLTRGGFLRGPRQMVLNKAKTNLLVASHLSGQVLSYAPNDAWGCHYSKSPCSKLPTTFSGTTKLSSITSMAMGAASLYAVGPGLGAIYRLNATTGAYIGRHEHTTCHYTGAPMGVAYLDGHLFVSVGTGKIERFNALTGEYYGVFAANPGVMSRPNQLLWY